MIGTEKTKQLVVIAKGQKKHRERSHEAVLWLSGRDCGKLKIQTK